MKEYQEKMSIVLNGKDEVDLNTFTSVMNNTTKILKKSTQYSQDGEYQKFIVKDVRKGSFIIDLVAIVANDPSLLSTAATAISMFKDFLDIKKHLDNQPPITVKENNQGVMIENNYGNVIITDKSSFNAYTDTQEIEDSITRIMKALENDKNVENLELSIVSEETKDNEVENKSIYTPSKMSEFYDVSQLVNDIETDISEQKLKITKTDFIGNSKWQAFINGTQLISFNIEDDEFKEKISDYSFTLGTMLIVDLESRYHVDGNKMPVLNKKTEYKVLKVHKVIKPEKNEQITLYE